MYDTFVPSYVPKDTPLFERPIIVADATFIGNLRYKNCGGFNEQALPIFFVWPDTPEAREVLHTWWDKTGRNEGTAGITRFLGVYPMQLQNYRIRLANEVEVGFTLGSDKITYFGRRRTMNRYDAALFRYILNIMETTKPLPFEEGEKLWIESHRDSYEQWLNTQEGKSSTPEQREEMFNIITSS